MTTLRVTLDALAARSVGGASRYAAELARGLITTAPDGTRVIGIVPSSPQSDYDRIGAKLPGLAGLEKHVLAHRELAVLWRRGLGRATGRGMLHATSLLAPLGPHDRVNHPGEQVAVTIHDATSWTHPELLPRHHVAWLRAMGQRAQRYADAVIVPSHAVADSLAEHLRLGERLRVIPGAPSASLVPRGDTSERRARLGLPGDYVLTVVGSAARDDVASLIAAARDADAPLVIVGAVTDEVRELADAAPAGSVRLLGGLSDDDLGVVYRDASCYVQASITAGLGLALIEALGFGLPIIHTALPALEEITAGAAHVVPTGDDLAAALADAIRSLDSVTAEQLSTAAGDRARAFSWRDSAARVWQLHADL